MVFEWGADMVSWIFMGRIMVRTVMGVNLSGIEPSWDFHGDVQVSTRIIAAVRMRFEHFAINAS